MGVLQSLKDLYYHLEDRYYDLIDRISTHIPIYKVTDAIDKVVPSFALLLLIIVVLIGYALISFTPVIMPKSSQIVVLVEYRDRYGEKYPLEGASVTIVNGELSTTIDTNEDGMLSTPYIAKIGDTISISIAKEDFKPKPYSTEFKVDEETEFVHAVLDEIIKYKNVRFRLVDEEGNPIANKFVSLSFECGNGVEAPADMETITDFTGLVEVSDVLMECDPLLVSVSAKGYESLSRERVTDGSALVLKTKEELTPPEEKGRIIVSVIFNGNPVEEAIAVELYKDTGASPMFMEYKTTENGQVIFEVLAGTYKVKTRATQKYDSAESNFITVGANEYRTVTLEVEEKIIGHIKLKVVDEANEEPLKDVRVTLMKESSQVAFDETDETGAVQFNLTKDEAFTVVIDHPEYCLARLTNVRKSDSVIEVKLKKYTGNCGGVLIAKVVDEDNNPIANALVGIFDEKGNSLGWKERVTDINGEAEFKGLKAGKYKFFAYKGYGSGWSDVLEYRVREAVEERATIVLKIPKATIELRVVNYELEPLPFSDVTLKNADTDKLLAGPMKIEDLNGKISFNVDAGIPFYVYVTNSQYASYATEAITLKPNEKRFLQIELEAKRISGDIEVDFLGLFKGDKTASVVAAGKEYIAKFRLSIPEQANYQKFGLHIRTGKYNVMEKDFIYIKEVYAPGKPNIIRGTSFNPGQGISYDTQFLSADGSKWVNLEWTSSRTGVIYVNAKIKIKETAIEEELPIFWRAWAIKEDRVIRDPVDYSLGDTASEQDLYAKAYKRAFQVGMEKLCTDKWCVSLKILDIENDIAEYVDETYNAKVGKDYELSFSILNNSPYETDTFDNVQLKIFNSEKNITFKDYEIVGDTATSGTANANETPYIEIGNLPRNKEVRGEITFVPNAAMAGTIMIRLHDPARHIHIFEKEILVDVAAANEFIVEFKTGEEFAEEPPMLPSGIENKVIIRVRDKATGLEVSEASVKVKDKFGATLVSTSTTSRGLAEITLPALMPAEVVYLAVEKPDYAEFTKEIKVDEKVLKIEPENIGVQLNVHTKPLDSVTVRLLNETEMELKVESIELSGDFLGLIDREKARSWLSSEYFGKNIAPKDKLDIALKVQLSDLGKLLNESKQLSGKLSVTVSSAGQSWVAESDVAITIGLGGEVDNPACLIVSINEWKTATKSNEVRTDFTIVNTCTLNGKPIKLQNLSAKIEWQSNQLGDYYIEIGENSVELRGAYFKVLRGTINEEEELPAILTFAPDGGVTGKAQATITISAEHPTQGGKETLTAEIQTEIDIVSLDNCIRFDKDLVRIKPGEEGTFTIETKECGASVDFMLDTELVLAEKEFTLESSDSKQVTILGGEYIPGQYPIYVKTKSVGESEYSIRKLIRVIMEPEGCLRLNRYEYDIYDDPNDPYDGFDVGKLINTCYKKKENITISFDERNWLEAMKTGAVWAIVGFVYGGIQSVRHGKDFFGNPLPSTICEEAGYEYCGAKMECKGEKIKVVKNVTCCASECIAEEVNIKEKICAKRGARYCGFGNCPEGKEKIVEGIKCCTDKCITEQLLENSDAKCRDVNENYDFCSAPPFSDVEEICPAQYGYERVGDIWCCKGPCQKAQPSMFEEICKNPGSGEGPFYYCNAVLGQSCPSEDKIVNVSGVACCTVECVGETPSKAEISPEKALSACQQANPSYTYCNPEANLSCEALPGAEINPVVEIPYTDVATGEETTVNCCDIRYGQCSPATTQPTEPITPGASTSDAATCSNANMGPSCSEQSGLIGICENPSTGETKASQSVNGTPCCPKGYNCRYMQEGSAYIHGDTVVVPGAPCPVSGYTIQCPPDAKCSSTYCGNCIANPKTPTAVGNTYCCPGPSYNKCILPDGREVVEGQSLQTTTQSTTQPGTQYTYSNEDICRQPSLIDPLWTAGSYYYCHSDEQCPGSIVKIYYNGNYSEGYVECCDAPCIPKGGTRTVTSEAGTETGTGELSDEQVCTQNGYVYCGPNERCMCTAETCTGNPNVTVEYNGRTVNCCDPMLHGECVPSGSLSAPAANPAKSILPTGLLSIGDIGNLFSGSFDLVGSILNIEDPWTGALLGFVAGTLFKYWEQSQNVGEFTVPVAVKDLVINSVKILMPKGLEEQEETLITAELGESKVESTADNPLGIEEIEIIFKNNGITQEEPYKPIYRVLKVEGERLDYNTEYFIDSKKKAQEMREMEPTVKSREPFTQKFHLQFNAYKPKPTEIVVRPETSCKIGSLIGSTGENALPRVKFRWNWRDIEINECDEGGNETYCDATQFSIELLKKIHRIDELLRNQQLNCPSAEGILSEKTQNLDELKLDVALTKIKIEKSGKNAKVIGTVESNNNKEMTVNAVITLQKDGSDQEIACPEGAEKAVQVISKAEVSCTFNDLSDGLYTARIKIYPQLDTCESECKNENTGNDMLFTKLLVGSAAGIFEKCEPYSTERLEEFIAANPDNTNLRKALELVSFNAYLIKDGYTLDFRRDFHEYSEAKDFFNAPTWYKGEGGLGKYFVNQELFEFKSAFLRPEFGYLPAGKYHVRINIIYNNDSWCLFDEITPDAKIEVYLERLSTPEPDSVFYYLPFDGLIGVDSENGRQGYGINFRQESEQSVPINEDISQPVRTTTIANSTPIPGGWLYAKKVQNFKTLNNDMRGVLLDIERGSEDTAMLFSPSKPTPVILHIQGGERRKAYAFYQVTVDGQPQQGSSYLAEWTGIGKGCRDFSDAEITETFDNRRDVRGGTGRIKCAGNFATHQYGLEWCDVKRKGHVFLKTVFFTPLESVSTLELVEAADDAVFIAPNATGKQIELSGTGGLDITSVEKILELVKEEKVCVAGVGNSVKATFFWNLKNLIDSTLSNILASVPQQCIAPEAS